VLPVSSIEEMVKILLRFVRSISEEELKGKAFLLSEKHGLEFSEDFSR